MADYFQYQYMKDTFKERLQHLQKDVIYEVKWIGQLFTGDRELEFDVMIKPVNGGEPMVIYFQFRFFRLFKIGLFILNGSILFNEKNSSVRTLTTNLKFNSLKSLTVNEFEYVDVFKFRYSDGFTFIDDSPVLNWNDVIKLQLDNQPLENVPVSFILPMNESCRFYYFPSSRLAQVILESGSITSNPTNKLFLPNSLSRYVEEVKEIIVRDDMLVRDIPIIARIAYSNVARAGASIIAESTRYADAYNKFFLNTILPYEVDSTLEVKGVLIPWSERIENKRKALFIVTEIISCTAPFPFEKLLYDRETPLHVKYPNTTINKIITKSDEIELEDIFSNENLFTFYRPEFDGPIEFNNNLRTNSKTALAKVLTPASQFIGLTSDIKRMKRGDRTKNRKRKWKIRGKVIDTGTTDPQKDKNSVAASMETVSDNLIGVDLGDLRAFMNDLRTQFSLDKDVSFFNPPLVSGSSNLYTDGKEENIVRTLEFVGDYSETNKFGYTESGKKKSLIIIPINFKGKHFVVMEFEPQYRGNRSALRVVYHSEDIRRIINNNDVDEILDELINNNGLMKTNTYALRRFYHTSGSKKTDRKLIISPEQHKIRILKAISEVV